MDVLFFHSWQYLLLLPNFQGSPEKKFLLEFLKQYTNIFMALPRYYKVFHNISFKRNSFVSNTVRLYQQHRLNDKPKPIKFLFALNIFEDISLKISSRLLNTC